MKPVLLREADAIDQVIKFWMEYDPSCQMDPETMLVEKDLLAPMFDAAAHPVYRITTSRIDAMFESFDDAHQRYKELAKNFNAKEIFKHKRIFRWVD